MRVVGAIATSPWLPLGLFLAGIVVFTCIHFDLLKITPPNEERMAERDSDQNRKQLDLKAFPLGMEYHEATTELVMHLMFRNNGTVQRTILSVTFGYRDPDRTWKNSWEFITPIPGYLGDVQPIRIEADSEHVKTFRVVLAHRYRSKVGGVIGLLLNATDPSGKVKSGEVEVIEISKSIPDGHNGIAYTGKGVEGVSFDA